MIRTWDHIRSGARLTTRWQRFVARWLMPAHLQSYVTGLVVASFLGAWLVVMAAITKRALTYLLTGS